MVVLASSVQHHSLPGWIAPAQCLHTAHSTLSMGQRRHSSMCEMHKHHSKTLLTYEGLKVWFDLYLAAIPTSGITNSGSSPYTWQIAQNTWNQGINSPRGGKASLAFKTVCKMGANEVLNERTREQNIIKTRQVIADRLCGDRAWYKTNQERLLKNIW